MLACFEIKNFKNFKALKLDLETAKKYEFNEKAVENGVVKTSIVYGRNATGKTNLGLALLDISEGLTDNYKNPSAYNIYLNLNSDMHAEFYYKFKFANDFVEYRYVKSFATSFITETLKINEKEVIHYNHLTGKGNVNLKGTEHLNLPSKDLKISCIKYVNSNSVLDYSDKNNILFKNFIDFVQGMVFMGGLGSTFVGWGENANIDQSIIEKNKLQEFENFLKEVGIDYKLFAQEINGKKYIECEFKNGRANLWNVASQGTKQLAYQFYWIMDIDKLSFIYMDEFDARYHFELARYIIKMLVKTKPQMIFSSHNTALMSNNILRPDCYFEIENNSIRSFADATEKEIREAHNIEKMYRAGEFNDTVFGEI